MVDNQRITNSEPELIEMQKDIASDIRKLVSKSDEALTTMHQQDRDRRTKERHKKAEGKAPGKKGFALFFILRATPFAAGSFWLLGVTIWGLGASI